MKNQPQNEKDFFLIAKTIRNEQKLSTNQLDAGLESRFNKQSEEALRMIEAYRKVQNVKQHPVFKNARYEVRQKNQSSNHEAKSSYANKIKQTLRQLNANKAKQYEKLAQQNSQLKSEKNINSLKVQNKLGVKAKSEQQKNLMLKSIEKTFAVLVSIHSRIKNLSLSLIVTQAQKALEGQYQMARKYRMFRLFSLWNETAKVFKVENQRKKQQNKQKELQAIEIATEFRIFTIQKRVLKSWSKLAKLQKKKRKYEQELKQTQSQRLISKKQPERMQVQKPAPNSTGPLENKLKGFLNGLKQKIEQKQNKKNLHPIIQQTEESQQASRVFLQQPQTQQTPQNQIELNQGLQTIQALQNVTNQSQPQKQVLSNQALLKNRKQIYERSKNRKQALQKLKKQKEMTRKKEEQERKQLERKIQEQQKRIKQLRYKQFQERKKLQKQWEQRQIQLSARADAWNRIRLLKFCGMEHWKMLKHNNQQNAKKINNCVEKIMLKHVGQQLIQNLFQIFKYHLESLYDKMDSIHERNLKRKCIKGFSRQLKQGKQQKIHLEAFHEVQTQKIFLSQWKQILDVLRLQNMEEERPLLKRATEYHRVSLLMKYLQLLKNNAIESKKEKKINEQKQKIKSKIKNIISQKIQINYDDFL